MVSIQVKKSVGGKLTHSQMEQEEDRGRRKDESGKKQLRRKMKAQKQHLQMKLRKRVLGYLKWGIQQFETRRTERQRAAEEVKQKKSER